MHQDQLASRLCYTDEPEQIHIHTSAPCKVTGYIPQNHYSSVHTRALYIWISHHCTTVSDKP